MPRRGARKGAVLKLKSRGGARQGAGRKVKLEAASRRANCLSTICSASAPARRDWAAKTALGGMRAVAAGKKEAEATAAESAGQNTAWASDLDFDAPHN
jgi:hypothetical protein